ncbi:hypothetical protein LZC95_48955 [Pendulispora brunnea]|uniref:Uncharacterized protein n=1 Tax=Pendulispora brunnea TaxID=2905690 RepID=A0ABZ2K6R7_9BACT
MAGEAPENYDYDIQFSLRRPLFPTGEPSDYVLDFEARINWDPDGDGSSPEVQHAGRVVGYVIEAARAIREGDALLDVCDSVDQNLCNYYELLFATPGNHLRDGISDGDGGDDVLIMYPS